MDARLLCTSDLKTSLFDLETVSCCLALLLSGVLSGGVKRDCRIMHPSAHHLYEESLNRLINCLIDFHLDVIEFLNISNSS